MSITTFTSREFNQDASRAKNATRRGPVIITDRGKAAHVLLTIDDYNRLAGGTGSIVDLLSMPAGVDIEFDAPRLDDLARPAELT